jgi:hypothetical protein
VGVVRRGAHEGSVRENSAERLCNGVVLQEGTQISLIKLSTPQSIHSLFLINKNYLFFAIFYFQPFQTIFTC